MSLDSADVCRRLDRAGIGRIEGNVQSDGSRNRPHSGLWRAAAGEAGVIRLLELLEIEIRTAMAMIGVKRLAELCADHLEFCGVRGSSDRPSPLLPADIVA